MDGRRQGVGEESGDEEEQPPAGGHGHAEPEPELVYSSAVEFFAELLAQSYVREVNEGAAFAWCPEWYKYPEALIRIEAIWRGLGTLTARACSRGKHLVAEPRRFPHMRVLLDKEGPFKKRAYDGHKTPRPRQNRSSPQDP
ncbi:DUF4913 domain-containing protein [Arthrobacter sp. AK04]|uniref:DUF4913 domain-containing protein n=1 Tax=Arthrobacter sp. AK04 TaxID=2900048 RepID=UPI0035ABAE25